MDNDLINMSKVQLIVGLGERSIRRLVRDRKFPQPLRLGGARRWRRGTIEKWVMEQETGVPTMVSFNISAGTASALPLEARYKVHSIDAETHALLQTPDGKWHLVPWLTTPHYGLFDVPILAFCEDESIPTLPLTDALARVNEENSDEN